MRSILISLTAFVLCLTFTIGAEGGKGGGGGGGGKGSSGGGGKNWGSNSAGGGKNWGSNSGGGGGKNVGGLRPRNYTGWTYYCVFDSGAYGYYSPDDNSWYYWYGPDEAFRPVTDMASYPPDNSRPPMLPPGARPLP